MSVTPLPSAEGAGDRSAPGLRQPRLVRLPRRIRRLLPRTFQGRLTIAFIGVIALILVLVTVLVLNRLDDYFSRQQTTDLEQRSQTVSTKAGAVGSSSILSRRWLTWTLIVFSSWSSAS